MNDQSNPWKTHSSKIVYQNPWITVKENQVTRPDGKPGIYGIVEKSEATGVVALTKNNEIYLVGQYRYPTECYSWEIIEGGTDPGESPQTAAQRELKEEAGLIAGTIQQLGPEVHLSNCVSSEKAFFFLATDLEETEAEPEETEVLTVKKVPFSDAFSMLLKGEIVDAMTIIGLYRAKEHLKI
jgi:ADP-ribose pyrophosphatase